MTAIDSLLAQLHAQQDNLSRLLELIQEERSCLLTRRLERLESIVQEQSAHLATQARLSRDIIQSLARSARLYNLEGRITLAHLAEVAHGEDAQRLGAYYQSISSLTEEVRRESRINWHLSQQALQYIDYTLKLIGKAKEAPLPYAPKAQTYARPTMQLLVDGCA